MTFSSDIELKSIDLSLCEITESAAIRSGIHKGGNGMTFASAIELRWCNASSYCEFSKVIEKLKGDVRRQADREFKNPISVNACLYLSKPLFYHYSQRMDETFRSQAFRCDIEKLATTFDDNLVVRYVEEFKDASWLWSGPGVRLNNIEFIPRYESFTASMVPEIKDVIFNKPATIVLWKDGTKTVVKCGKKEKFDKEKGLAMAICKKLLGTNQSKSNFNDVFKKWMKED